MTTQPNPRFPEEPDNFDPNNPSFQPEEFPEELAHAAQDPTSLKQALPILKKLSKKDKTLATGEAQTNPKEPLPQLTPDEKEAREKRQRLIFTAIVVSIVALLIAGGYLTFGTKGKKTSSPASSHKEATVAEKTTPKGKQVELRNTERAIYSHLGEKKDAQGQKIEYLLQTRINAANGSTETLVAEKVNGSLASEWRPLQAGDLTAVERTHPIVPPNQPGLTYSYGGKGTNENGEAIDYLIVTDTRRQPPHTFVRVYNGQGQPAGAWSRSLAFTPQNAMTATLDPNPPLASGNLQNSSKGAYSHAGAAQDEAGNQVEYVLYTRWSGLGEEDHQETFVNKRVNGELAPTWSYLSDTDIPTTSSPKEGVVPASNATQIYSYGGATTNANGDRVEYIVAHDRYNAQAAPQVQEVINGYPASQTTNIQDAPITQAKPFIPSKASGATIASAPILTRPVPQTPVVAAQAPAQHHAVVSTSTVAENASTATTNYSTHVASSSNSSYSSSSSVGSGTSTPSSGSYYSGDSSSSSGLVTRPANPSGYSAQVASSSNSSNQHNAASSSSSSSKPNHSTNSTSGSSSSSSSSSGVPGSTNSGASSSSGSNPSTASPSSSTTPKVSTGGSTFVAYSADMSDAERMFLNLFYKLRSFSVILLFIGVVAAALMFAIGQKQMALNVIVASAILFGVPSIIILVMEALHNGG